MGGPQLPSFGNCGVAVKLMNHDPKSHDWYERQKSRERLKLIGLLAVAALILLIAFLRFGKTIPWGAR
jgi:hypothetical protein